MTVTFSAQSAESFSFGEKKIAASNAKGTARVTQGEKGKGSWRGVGKQRPQQKHRAQKLSKDLQQGRELQNK